MAVQIPTLSELYNDILADLENELSINIPLFGKIFLRGLAAVMAARLKLYYLAIAKLQKNIFPDLADPESTGGTLERFGMVKLGRSRFAARSGSYVVTVTGTSGSLIKAQSTFKSDDTALNPGILYILDADYTMPGATGSITLRALTSGLNSQLIVGNTLTSTAPIANVNSLATVTSESISPLSQETIEEYREKIVQSFQLEPQGGSVTDYRIWSADAQGVDTVYPYAKSGFENEINVFVEATIADSTDGKGTPSATILSDVEDVIEFDPDTSKPLDERGRRPLGVFLVNVLPVTPLDVDITISSYVGLTPTIQASILAAITDALSRVRPYVAGADVEAQKNDIFGEFNISFIIQQAVPGSRFNSITLSVDSVDVSAYQFLNGNIPFLNSITYD